MVTDEQIKRFMRSPVYLQALADGQKAVMEAKYAAYVAELELKYPVARQEYDLDLTANETAPSIVGLPGFAEASTRSELPIRAPQPSRALRHKPE